uniref:Putative secreted protein n=1 Tax=Anopheles darlingi TaxID=43151 RepID=A0A2M4D8F1_ANODA
MISRHHIIIIINALLLSAPHLRSRSFLTLSVPQVGRIETMVVPMPTDLAAAQQEAKKSRVKQLTDWLAGGFL